MNVLEIHIRLPAHCSIGMVKTLKCRFRKAWFHTKISEHIYWLAILGHTFLERTLFIRNTTIPKSYVVGFKYVGDVSSTVIAGGIIRSDAQVGSFSRCSFFAGFALFNFMFSLFYSALKSACCHKALKNVFLQYYLWFRTHGAVLSWAMALTFMTITI